MVRSASPLRAAPTAMGSKPGTPAISPRQQVTPIEPEFRELAAPVTIFSNSLAEALGVAFEGPSSMTPPTSPVLGSVSDSATNNKQQRPPKAASKPPHFRTSIDYASVMSPREGGCASREPTPRSKSPRAPKVKRLSVGSIPAATSRPSSSRRPPRTSASGSASPVTASPRPTGSGSQPPVPPQQSHRGVTSMLSQRGVPPPTAPHRAASPSRSRPSASLAASKGASANRSAPPARSSSRAGAPTTYKSAYEVRSSFEEASSPATTPPTAPIAATLSTASSKPAELVRRSTLGALERHFDLGPDDEHHEAREAPHGERAGEAASAKRSVGDGRMHSGAATGEAAGEAAGDAKHACPRPSSGGGSLHAVSVLYPSSQASHASQAAFKLAPSNFGL